MSETSARVSVDGGRLAFSGALLRPDIAALWRSLPTGSVAVTQIDLSDVGSIDSAGLACLALVARRHPDADITGQPAGYPELRAAYRLDEHLSFAD